MKDEEGELSNDHLHKALIVAIKCRGASLNAQRAMGLTV